MDPAVELSWTANRSRFTEYANHRERASYCSIRRLMISVNIQIHRISGSFPTELSYTGGRILGYLIGRTIE